MFSAQQFLFTMNLQQIRRSLWDLKHVKIRRATKSPVCWNPFHGRFKKNLLIPFVKHVVACCKGNGTVFDICPVVEWSEAAGSKWFVATIDLNRRVSLASTWTLSEVSQKKTDLIRDKAASQSCSQPWSLTLLIQLLEQGDHAGRRIASVVGRPQDLQPAGIFFMFCIFFILHIFTFFVIFLLIWLLLSLRSLQQTLAQRCPGHFIVHDEWRVA